MNDVSMFGYLSDNPVDCTVYDMMVMNSMGLLEADRQPGEVNDSLGSNQYSGREPVRMEW